MGGAPIFFPRGREIVLGVSAGIAAYKACDVLRRLQDHGFLVTVVPTESSLNFVGKATWQALSGREVLTSVWEKTSAVSHISIAEQADLILIAPATADVIARIAHGRADDLLTTTVLAAQCPVIVVPAMHPQMWLNPATVANVETLRERGMVVMEPEVGRLTGKDSGVGRFPETKTIINQVLNTAAVSNQLLQRKVLVTAGGTREAIDPVRFIGNRSSGRQGLAVAYEALCSGAQVTVVAGQTDPFELPGAQIIEVESATQMREAVLQLLPQQDAVIMSAAVADVRVAGLSEEKIKKEKLTNLELVDNPDILAEIGALKNAKQVVVGFAAETAEDLEIMGREKLLRKNADLLYVNNVAKGKIFGESTTSGLLLDREIVLQSFDEVDKHIVAKAIVKQVAKRLEFING